MTLEYLKERKEKYQNRQQYFSVIGFEGLANSFQGVVDLISEMEEYIKTKNDECILEAPCEEEAYEEKISE